MNSAIKILQDNAETSPDALAALYVIYKSLNREAESVAVLSKLAEFGEKKQAKFICGAYSSFSHIRQLDQDDRIAWLERNLELGDYSYAGQLARVYLFGSVDGYRGNHKENPRLSEAIELLEKSADAGGYEASFTLPDVYKTLGDWQNYQKFVEKYPNHVNIREAPTMYYSYVEGANGFEKSPENATKWLKKAYRGWMHNEIAAVYKENAKDRELTEDEIAKIRQFKLSALDMRLKESYHENGSAEIVNEFLLQDSEIAFKKGTKEYDDFVKKYSDEVALSYPFALLAIKEKDKNSAFKLFKSAADKGNLNALGYVYLCYKFGIGTQSDEALADEYMNKYFAAIDNHYNRTYELQKIRWFIGNLEIKMLDSDKNEFIEKLYLSALKTYPSMALNLLFSHYVNNKNYTAAAKLLEEYGEMGISASTLLDFYLSDSEYHDLTKAFEAAKRIENRHNSMQYSFAYPLMLIYGVGTVKDEEYGIKLLSQFYHSWDDDVSASAQLLMSYFYERGIGIDKDSEKAAELRGLAKQKMSNTRSYTVQYLIDMLSGKQNNDYTRTGIFPVDKEYAKTIAMLDPAIYESMRADEADNLLYSEKSSQADKQQGLEIFEALAKENPKYNSRLLGLYKSDKYFYNPEKCFDALQKYCAYLEEESQKESSGKEHFLYGLAEVKYQIACFYMQGLGGVEKDEKKSFELLNEVYANINSLNKFYAPAVELLAYSYEKGIGTDANIAKAEELRNEIMQKTLACLADEKFCRSCTDNFNDIANRYSGDVKLEFPKDSERAIYWEKLSADNFDNVGSLTGIYLHYSRRPQHRDWNKAFEYLKKYDAYSKDNSWIDFRKGYLHLFGKILEKNEAEGVRLITKSAEAGYPYAQEYLSYLYEKGIGVEQNLEKSKEWFEKFKKHTDREFWEIAGRYVAESDLIKDYERSKFILKTAAEQGREGFQKDVDNFDAFAEKILAGN